MANSSCARRRIAVEIQTFEDGGVLPRLTKAYTTSEPGLVVQHDSGHSGVWLKTWAVTHRASGYRLIGGFRTLKVALEYAEMVGYATDWTEDRETLLAQREELVPKLRLITETFKGHRVA